MTHLIPDRMTEGKMEAATTDGTKQVPHTARGQASRYDTYLKSRRKILRGILAPVRNGQGVEEIAELGGLPAVGAVNMDTGEETARIGSKGRGASTAGPKDL